MKAKNIQMIAVGTILAAAVMVSYLMSRPVLFARESKIPVFMGEEITVQRAITAVKAGRAVRVERDVMAAKAVTAPVPAPEVAVPLPILPPRVSYRVLPEYPVSALEQGLQGTAVLSIYVGLSGAAEKVEVKSSSGVVELDASAVSAVSEWKFNPAVQGGAPLASWFEVPIKFVLN